MFKRYFSCRVQYKDKCDELYEKLQTSSFIKRHVVASYSRAVNTIYIIPLPRTQFTKTIPKKHHVTYCIRLPIYDYNLNRRFGERNVGAVTRIKVLWVSYNGIVIIVPPNRERQYNSFRLPSRTVTIFRLSSDTSHICHRNVNAF